MRDDHLKTNYWCLMIAAKSERPYDDLNTIEKAVSLFMAEAEPSIGVIGSQITPALLRPTSPLLHCRIQNMCRKQGSVSWLFSISASPVVF